MSSTGGVLNPLPKDSAERPFIKEGSFGSERPRRGKFARRLPKPSEGEGGRNEVESETPPDMGKLVKCGEGHSGKQ